MMEFEDDMEDVTSRDDWDQEMTAEAMIAYNLPLPRYQLDLLPVMQRIFGSN